MTPETAQYHNTNADLLEVVGRARDALVLRVAPWASASPSATVRVLLRFCRMEGRNLEVVRALRKFETEVRPALVAHWQAARKADLPLGLEAEFLIEHFDQFTEVPINASPVKRVVSWARRNYRAWRKSDP